MINSQGDVELCVLHISFTVVFCNSKCSRDNAEVMCNDLTLKHCKM